MLIPVGWQICVTLVVPAWMPAPPGHVTGSDPVPSESQAEVAAKVDAYVRALSLTLGPGPRAALPRIPDRERHLLAIAHYLRRQDQIDTLWTWSVDEARAHEHTDEYRFAMDQVQQVRRAFAELNPGYVLVTDTSARLIGTQVRYWNREPSVRIAARRLQDRVGAWLAGETFPADPDSAALARFADRLKTYPTTDLPTVAVPGLSLHGRLRAYDFAILRRGRLIAGTQSATMDSVWDRAGWTERLREAVTLAGVRLAGPMETPREPWHYEYLPERP